MTWVVHGTWLCWVELSVVLGTLVRGPEAAQSLRQRFTDGGRRPNHRGLWTGYPELSDLGATLDLGPAATQI